jgi:polysaccharide transporter, PST family
MSQSLGLESKSKSSTADAFLVGVAAMLMINVLQRVVGLARNLGFSMFLPEDQLGLWSLANSFFIIAPPFIVLGLPGSFGKYVEHYRQRGHLRAYLVRVGKVCLVGLVGLMALMLVLPAQASVLLYGHEQPYSIIVWTVITLAILTVHNFLYDIVLSLRLIRLVSIMQFVNSTAFCVLGVAGIYYFRSWIVLLPCYGMACLLAMLPGLYGIATARQDFQDTQPLQSSEMWRRILPFAMAMWLTNLLTNAYELCDRYMLLHLSNMGAEAGQALVGQYYCARILPSLLLSLAMMFSGILLPYLSADWERKQFSKITQSMNNILVLLSLTFTGLSLAALAAAPILFHWILGSRFNPAFEILPIGMMQATWSGLAMIAANYLLCAEKGRQNAMILAVGLILNIALNWPLITWLGLYGAAIATSTSSAVLFLLICWRLHREGCPINRKTIVISLLPISLILGVYITALIFLILAIVCGRTDWLLTDEDRESINRAVLPRLQRIGLPISSLWLRV